VRPVQVDAVTENARFAVRNELVAGEKGVNGTLVHKDTSDTYRVLGR
jgi:hypothetical protein